MAKGIITTQYLTDIADAIRAKLDASDTYTPAQMAGAIESISGTNQDYEDALVAFGVQSDLADGITALTTYSNEITGESDTTLSDAVRSLADGYGGGDDTDFANTIMRGGAITRIPDSVTRIGPYAFYVCNNLTLTELPSGVTSIGTYAFYNCNNLTLTELPSGVTSIGDYAFYNCTNLALTELPSGVTSIGSNAFRGCTNLALTELPSGVTSTGNYAFYGCSGLQQLDAQNVGTINTNAFNSCHNLTELVLRKSDKACSLSSASAFNNTPMRGYSGKSGTVYVPQALIETYKSASNWSTIYNEGHLTFAAIEGSKWGL